MTEPRRRPGVRPSSDLDWLRELLDERFAGIREDSARQQRQLDQIQVHLAGRRDELDAVRAEFHKEIETVKTSVGELRDTIKTWAGAVALGALIATAVIGPAVVEIIKRTMFG